MRQLRTYLALGTAGLLLALGCSAKQPDQNAAPKPNTPLELRIEKTARPSHDEDDGFYIKGTHQYRIIAGKDTLDTRLPDLALRGHPDLSYYTAIKTYQENDLPKSDWTAFRHERSVDIFSRDAKNHPETQRFFDYLSAPENSPGHIKPGTKAEPIPIDSLRTPTGIQHYFGKTVPIERTPIDRASLQLSLTPITTYEGTLEEVIREANSLQNTTYKTWSAEVRHEGRPIPDKDYEGFFFPLIRKDDGTYLLHVYGISITGQYTDGSRAEF